MTSGTYSVINIDENGCQQQSNEITVTVYPNPSALIQANGPLTFCEGEDVELELVVTPGVISYQWNTGESTQAITVEDAGSYYATVTTADGCIGSSDTVDVNVWGLPDPIVTTVGIPSFCSGDTIFLTTTEEFETYFWSTGDTMQTTFALLTGFYTVEVTDTNGCSATSPESLITVNESPDPTTTPDGFVDICLGDTITITSVEAASYLWTTGDTTQSILVWQAGIYNVTATDSSGCVGTSADVIVSVNPLPDLTIVVDDTLDFCLGGAVNLSTLLEYESYSWSTGAISQSITVTESGTYIVTVTDSLGCAAASVQADVTVYQLPTVSVTTTGPSQFCFGDSVLLTSSPGISYLWSNGATTQSIWVFTSGSLNVQVTDENGCVGESDLVIIEVYSLPNAEIIADGPTEFCLGDSVTLTATGGINYVWSTGSTAGSIVAYNSESYYVVVDNQFGCVDTSASVSVLVNEPPVVAIFPDGPTEFCDGDSVGLVASGADTYLWSTGETGPVIVVTTSGLYSVIGTDADGCITETSDIEITVYQNAVPTIMAGGPTEFCDGNSVVLTSSIAESYLWSTGATTQSIIVLTTGSYTVSIEDELGCDGTSDPTYVEVFTSPTPTITLSGPAELCSGDSVVLTVSGADNYLWSTGDTTITITVMTSGDYSVEVTDENGCVGESDDVTITVYDNPVVEILASDTVVCDGQIVTLTATESENYLWSTGANSQSIVVIENGMYGVTVTDGNGCMASDSIEITVNPMPTPLPVITPDGPTTFCYGDSVSVSVDLWESYLWSTGDTTQTIVVDESGLYVVTVINEFGCEADAAGVVVTVNPLPVPVIQATGDSAICEGETIILATNVFNTYLWSIGDTSQTIEVDTTGSFIVTVTNNFGCEGTSNAFSVVENSLPEISIEANGPTTICSDGEVTLTAIGDGPYLWSNGDTTMSILVTDAGTYFVQATDSQTGCVGTSEDVVVTFFPDFNPEIAADGPTTFCEGNSLTLTVVEGVSFLWSTGDTTQSIVVTSTGVYTVEVVETNGCSGVAGQTVTILPSTSTEIVPDLDFPYCDGDSITLTALGIPFINDFEWSPNGETTQSITVTESGVYTVTVTNPFGCSSTASLPIGFLPTPTAEIILDGSESICEGDEVILTASGFPFGTTWEWTNGETTQSISVSEAGTYSVSVTNFVGCSDTSEPVTINVVPGPNANAGPDTTICIGGQIVLTAMEGDNYLWNNGEITQSISVNPEDDTMYTVEVTNDGCNQVAFDDVWVFVQEYPTASYGYDHINLGQPIQFSDSSMVPPLFSWEWDFDDGNTSNEQNPMHDYEGPGEYGVTLTVSTSAGCSDDTTMILPVEEFFILTNVLTPNGDDYNDYIWITSSLADVVEAKFFNRWGLSVWEGVGTDLRFSGKTTEGLNLEDGTYYYVISLDYGEAGIKELTGYITLIRE
jgi:PKD repeat protein